jgi:hypothetical protein
MQTRLKLLQDWRQQLQALLPGIRATRVATFAAFTLGLLWAGTATLLKVAHALPLGVVDLSTERRLRRWLANRKVPVTALWRPLIKTMLASRAGTELLLALDPTPLRDVGNIYVLGLVAHKRVLPLTWAILPSQTDWSRPEIVYLRRLCRLVARWLPPGCTVTLLCDRGLTSPDLIEVCRSLGWHWVMRVSADAKQGPKLVDGRWLWALVPRPGQRWYGTVALFKRVGWITCELSIYWRHGYDAPWLLISDRPAGLARVGEYRRRDQAEATYQDCTRRGWNLGHRKVTDYNRLNRLLVVLFLGLWWAQQVGMRAIRCGERRLFDRADRRELSVARLGRCWLASLLDHGRPVPLPFHQRCSGWRFAWLF